MAIKDEILQKAKQFFRRQIMENHVKNLLKLKDVSAFKLNPFLYKYLANFFCGDSTPTSIAKALIYPRALGTSITTSFGTHFQTFCTEILSGYASAVSGIDIEFNDFLDNGRKKYCQVKAGPNTINSDDVTTILNHFSGIRNLARTNRLQVNLSDLVVGVFYGEAKDLSSHYLVIQKTHEVYIGKDFWHRLTGDVGFYDDLINSVAEVAKEADCRQELERTIQLLAENLGDNA